MNNAIIADDPAMAFNETSQATAGDTTMNVQDDSIIFIIFLKLTIYRDGYRNVTPFS